MEIRIDTTKTSEKYLKYKDVILPWFIEMMQEYEEKIAPLMKEYHELFKSNKQGQHSERIGELTEKSKELKIEILSGYISENIYISPYDSYPTSFSYFAENPELKFVMKSSKKVAVIAKTKDKYGEEIWHKFEFKPNDSEWKLDKMYMSYEGENGPYKKIDF